MIVIVISEHIDKVLLARLCATARQSHSHDAGVRHLSVRPSVHPSVGQPVPSVSPSFLPSFLYSFLPSFLPLFIP